MNDANAPLMRYARAIEAALADKTYESSHSSALTFYFDADVVVGAFRDIPDLDNLPSARGGLVHRLPREREQAALFRSLWLAGFACEARLLWPHEVELMRNLASGASPGSGREARLRIRKATARVFTPDHMDRLRKALSPAVDDSERLPMLAELLPLGYFSVLTASLRTWDQRMHMAGDRLVLHKASAEEMDTGYLSADPRGLALMCTRLERLRAPAHQRVLYDAAIRRPRIKGNTHADVCALLALDRQLQQAREGVRFHTGTRAVVRFLDTEATYLAAIRKKPSEARDSLDCGVLDRPKGVVRSSLYMLLRAIVPCLFFPNRRETLPPNAEGGLITAHDLDAFVNAVRQAGDAEAGLQGSDLERQWMHFIERLESVSAFTNVWSRPDSKALRYLQEALPEFSGLPTAVTEIATHQPEIHESEEAMRVRLDSEMTKLLDMTSILVAGDPPESPVPELSAEQLRGSGAARWLVILCKPIADIDSFLEWLRRENSGDGSPVPTNVQECTYLLMCAASFARGEERRIRRSWWPVKSTDPRIRFAAVILRQCAALMTHREHRSIAALNVESSHAESDLLAAYPQMRPAVGVLRGWRVLYWCHNRTGGMRKNLDPFLFSSDVRTASRAGLEDLAAFGSDKYAPAGTVAASLLTHALEVYLRVFSEGIDPRFDIEYDKLYTCDAWAWAAAAQGPVTGAEAVVNAARRRLSERLATDDGAETFLTEHLEYYERLLARWEAERV